MESHIHLVPEARPEGGRFEVKVSGDALLREVVCSICGVKFNHMFSSKHSELVSSDAREFIDSEKYDYE